MSKWYVSGLAVALTTGLAFAADGANQPAGNTASANATLSTSTSPSGTTMSSAELRLHEAQRELWRLETSPDPDEFAIRRQRELVSRLRGEAATSANGTRVYGVYDPARFDRRLGHKVVTGTMDSSTPHWSLKGETPEQTKLRVAERDLWRMEAYGDNDSDGALSKSIRDRRREVARMRRDVGSSTQGNPPLFRYGSGDIEVPVWQLSGETPEQARLRAAETRLWHLETARNRDEAAVRAQREEVERLRSGMGSATRDMSTGMDSNRGTSAEVAPGAGGTQRSPSKGL